MTVFTIATVVCVVANVGIVVADLVPARFVLDNSAEVGLRRETLPYLASLKAAGAAGVVVGLVGVTWLGLAAAIGLVLFYVGAVGAHLRARVLYNIAFPLLFLALAATSIVYFSFELA